MDFGGLFSWESLKQYMDHLCWEEDFSWWFGGNNLDCWGLDLGGRCMCLREVGHLESSSGAANGHLGKKNNIPTICQDVANGNLGGCFKDEWSMFTAIFLEGMIQFDICFQMGGKKQLEILGFALNKSINSTHDLCCGPLNTLILSSCDGTVDFSTHFLVGCRLEEVELVSCLGYTLVAPILSITLCS